MNHKGKPYTHGVGAVECIVVDPSIACQDAECALDRIGKEFGMERDFVEKIVKLALKRLHFSKMVKMVVWPLVNKRSDAYLVGLLAFAIERQLGWALHDGDMTLDDLENQFKDSKKRGAVRGSCDKRSVA